MNQAHTMTELGLMAYHDGELDPARRRQVEAHLAGCAECRRKLEALQALSRRLATDSQDKAIMPATAAWARLEARLPARAPATAAPANWLPGILLLLLNSLVQLGAAGAVAVALASQLSGITIIGDWLNSLAAALAPGWLVWLLPQGWDSLGVFVSYIQASIWLAGLYLAWLCYQWRYRWRPAAQTAIEIIGV